MDDFDSVEDSPTELSAQTAPTSDEQTTDQTSAGEQAPSQGESKSSEDARINGLMRAMGKKETEKQEALRERDEAQAALAEMQASLTSHMDGSEFESLDEAAPAQAPQPAPVAPVEPQERPAVFVSPTAPRSASASLLPESESQRALNEMNRAFNDHMRVLGGHLR